MRCVSSRTSLALAIVVLLPVALWLATVQRQSVPNGACLIGVDAASRPSAATALPPPALLQPNHWAARLYTPAGHDRRTAYDGMYDDDLAPLTRQTQAALLASQFPADDCAGRAMLISHGNCDSGIGSLMHVVGDHLAIAFGAGRTLVMAPDACGAWTDPVTCPDAPSFFSCFLAPLTSCTYEQAVSAGAPSIRGFNRHENLTAEIVPLGALWTMPTWWQSTAHVPADFRRALLAVRPGALSAEVKFWWRGQASGFMMRLNDPTIAALRAMRLAPSGSGSLVVSPPVHASMHGTFPLPPGTISTHMRMGFDKVGEMKIVALQSYLDAAEALVAMIPNAAQRALFVSSETQSAIDDAHRFANATVSLPATAPWTVTSMNILRVVGGDGASNRHESGEMVKHLPPVHLQSPGATTRQHLLNLVVALEGDHFIGTRGSNWNRLIDELRCTLIPKCRAYYVEVGNNWHGYNW